MSSSPRIAVVGCGHGCLNDIYADVEKQAAARGWTGVDCVIIGGDFQALRNANDAACISVPAKYKQMGDFHEYYSGQRQAPYLTIFCAGNHEASNYLFELYYGGWVAPNIYYLGAANVLRLGPLRISGMSGIWKGYDYRKPHFERLPYNSEDVQSVYHIRELDVRKLLQIRTQVDVGLSHDWPRGIERFGDQNELFRKKKHLREDSTHGRLGSPAARDVIDRLRPAYWFSAHLHVKFAVLMTHDGARTRKATSNRDEPASWAHEEIVEAPEPLGDLITFDGHKSPEKKGVEEVRAATGTIANRLSAWNNFGESARRAEAIAFKKLREDFEKPRRPTDKGCHSVTYKIRDKNNQNSLKTEIVDVDMNKKQKLDELVQNTDEIDLGTSSESSNGSPARNVGSPNASNTLATGTDGAGDHRLGQSLVDQAVAQHVRTQLPASFARPPAAETKKVVPQEIKNGVTKFLALDKPGGHDPYVQLVEIKPISKAGNAGARRPLRLQYDKEWLAITRVFAKDLQLGDPNAEVPDNLGEEAYRAAIIEAEAWVEENVVAKGLMDVPYNFALTALTYDAQVPITTKVAPPEYTNPQTIAFCDLLQIPNPFNLSEEEREARVDAGPRSLLRPENDGKRRGGRGGRGRRGRAGGR